MTIYRRLLRYLRPYVWPRFVAAVVCMVLYSATNGAMPWLVRSVFDDIFVRKQVWAIQALPALIVGVFLFRGVMNYLQAYLMEWMG
ncbi:MAG: ABC transporter ATP-binding protein, partial [Candidatus Binatia bacterium]